jgi:hypothetical protein
VALQALVEYKQQFPQVESFDKITLRHPQTARVDCGQRLAIMGVLEFASRKGTVSSALNTTGSLLAGAHIGESTECRPNFDTAAVGSLCRWRQVADRRILSHTAMKGD